MNLLTNAQEVVPWYRRLGLFLALSRTPHGLLDLATPALAALLWLGAVPPLDTTLLGLLTAFAGYTSVYALNDLVDVAADRRKLAESTPGQAGGYLDAVGVRHPVAQGVLSLPAAVTWFALWAVLAMVGAYLLNPVCLYLFVAGAALEIVYCLMLKVSHLRSLISGLVKTTGAVAAVFAVDPRPSPWFLLLMWAWLYCWEIAGQNVPADLYDVEEDGRLGARTLPVVYGQHRASQIVLIGLGLTIILGAVVLALAPLGLPWPLSLVAWMAGLYLLMLPAWRLWRSGSRKESIILFNRSSYYPIAMLAVAVAGLLFGGTGS